MFYMTYEDKFSSDKSNLEFEHNEHTDSMKPKAQNTIFLTVFPFIQK